MTKSTVSCGFDHIYWINISWKTSFSCAVCNKRKNVEISGFRTKYQRKILKAMLSRFVTILILQQILQTSKVVTVCHWDGTAPPIINVWWSSSFSIGSKANLCCVQRSHLARKLKSTFHHALITHCKKNEVSSSGFFK